MKACAGTDSEWFMGRRIESGFGILDLLVTVVGVAVICTTALYVWNTKKSADATYANASKVYDTIDTTKSASLSRLQITEWGVTLRVAEPDAYYTMKADGTAYLTTKKLEQLTATVTGCRSGLHGITVDKTMTIVRDVELLCAVTISDTTKQIDAIIGHLKDAVRAAQ